jgi:YVTN family beta-propeller protein
MWRDEALLRPAHWAARPCCGCTTRLLVADNGSGSVSVVETKTLQESARIAAGQGPHGVAATPDGRFLLVANTESDTITILDAATWRIVAQVPVGGFPTDVALLP